MSPFAECFNKIRLQHGVRQKDLANRMGYEQAYISFIELDVKGPPPEAFIQQFCKVLNLSEVEAEKLYETAEASQRKLEIDGETHPDIFWMLQDIRKNLNSLSTVQIQLIRQILSIKENLKEIPMVEPRRIKRRVRQEVAM